jgi:hypothetical protein
LFRAADCDTNHYLVVAKVRKRLAMRKQTTHRVYMERFNLKKLYKVEGKEQYHVEISKWFTALENRPKRKKMDMRFGTWNVRSMYREVRSG